MPKKGSMCDRISKTDLNRLPMIEISRKYGIKHNTLLAWAKKHGITFKPFMHNKLYENFSIVESDDGIVYFVSGWKPVETKDGIFSLRTALGYDRDQFGTLFGKSGKAVATWEQGAIAPRLDDLKHMKSLWEDFVK